MAQDIVIGGRLHSAATGNTVAGANEILDDARGKKQNVINQEVDNEIGSDSDAGTIKGRIKNLETAVGSGGSVDERIAETKAEIIGDAAADYNTLGKVEDKIQETKSEILGDAASDYNTLGKVEDKIQAETSRAETAEGALDNAKANKATTLEGYGIIDAYTKNETYTKTEVNGLVDTPHQNYVTVLTYAALIAIDPGSTDTIYRVSNYDGSVPQVDVTKYSEYAWDGTQYVFLCVKSQIDEVFDISVYNNNATYADLAAALGIDGANVPQTLRRGGMSVKFVQSYDNNYTQFRYLLEYENTTAGNAAFLNTDNWSFCGNGVLIENPEYNRVWLDTNKRIYMAFTKDGNVYFGCGVPKQIIYYITNILSRFDDYEDIVNFLGSLISGSDTLSELLADKVDKTTGKSLIDEDFASGVSYIDNPEYSFAKLDSDNRIEFAVKKDGDFVFGCGIPSSITSLYGQLEENPEFLRVLVDRNRRIIWGAGVDGKIKTYDKKETEIIKGTQIERIVSLSNPVQILSSKDEDATQYDNGTIGFCTILKVKDLYYLYYIGTGYPNNGFSILFAYSEDGFNFTRGFPDGVDVPFPGNNGIICDPSNRGSYSFDNINDVFQVPDSEYPYRLIGEIGYDTYMWKSTDAIHWVEKKLIIPNLSDTQGSCVLRGNIVKMYCRIWDGGITDRQIGVVYFDIDGNIIAPPTCLFGHYYYNSAASPLDDRREILFPTHFDGRTKEGIVDEEEWMDCFIVDGVNITPVNIDTSIFRENTDKSIYASPGIITINGKQYLLTTLKDSYHNDQPYYDNARYKLVEIEFLTKGMIRGEMA